MSYSYVVHERHPDASRRRNTVRRPDSAYSHPVHDKWGNRQIQKHLAAGQLFERINDRRLNITSGNHQLEKQADNHAQHLYGNSNRSLTNQSTLTANNTQHNKLSSDPGSPFSSSVLPEIQPRFAHALGNVRIHKSAEAAQAAALLGAQAFTHGRDIYLSERASESDHQLMAHEIGHALLNQDVIQLRAATWLERRAWLAFFDHYLPRKFLNNYMDDTGNPITLTSQEMQDCNPIVNLRRSPAFMAEVARLQAAGGGTAAISCTGWGGALTNGTLGNFTIHYDGVLSVAADGSWTFTGTMWFEDYWDFNPGGANRPLPAEIKVRVANALLPGRPFNIDSVAVPVSQSSADSAASWSAAAPVHVPDRAGRAGTDIEVGAGAGAAGGPETEAGGGEFGAQSAEDLNP